MGTNGIPWSKTGLDGRVIMLRKRNNSSSEIANGKYQKQKVLNMRYGETKKAPFWFFQNLYFALNRCTFF